jgi:hypothetical protein
LILILIFKPCYLKNVLSAKIGAKHKKEQLKKVNHTFKTVENINKKKT